MRRERIELSKAGAADAVVGWICECFAHCRRRWYSAVVVVAAAPAGIAGSLDGWVAGCGRGWPEIYPHAPPHRARDDPRGDLDVAIFLRSSCEK